MAERFRALAAALALVLAGCAGGGSAGGDRPASTARPSTSATGVPPTSAPAARFRSTVSEIDEGTAGRMSASWRPGCPLALSELRLVSVSHWDMDGGVRQGELVVGATYAEAITTVFERLFEARFPIAQIRLVDEFGGDDDRSMAANNTSGFNCRRATGSRSWSEHAYGRAIDVNPVQNPFVTGGGTVLPPAGRAFADRARAAPGLIQGNGPVVEAFAAIGWKWGGNWTSGRDYQHFSATGR